MEIDAGKKTDYISLEHVITGSLMIKRNETKLLQDDKSNGGITPVSMNLRADYDRQIIKKSAYILESEF